MLAIGRALMSEPKFLLSTNRRPGCRHFLYAKSAT